MSRTDASYSAQQLRRFAAQNPGKPMSKHIEIVCDEFTRLSRIARAWRIFRNAGTDLLDALKDEPEEDNG